MLSPEKKALYGPDIRLNYMNNAARVSANSVHCGKNDFSMTDEAIDLTVSIVNYNTQELLSLIRSPFFVLGVYEKLALCVKSKLTS